MKPQNVQDVFRLLGQGKITPEEAAAELARIRREKLTWFEWLLSG